MPYVNDSSQPDNDLGAGFVQLVEANQMGRPRQFKKGQMLFWQGDPVEDIFVVKHGAVKLFSVSPDGRAYAFGILGAGGLAGASAFLLGKENETMAEAVEDTEVIAIPPEDFERQLARDAQFSSLVMKKLAQGVSALETRARDLGFLDVQQRIKNSLMELAKEHGIKTDDGIRIDLAITQEEIGELVAANRTTITAYLSEFKRQGYLWKDGRHLVIIPPEHMEILDNLSQAVVDGDEDAVVVLVTLAIEKNVDPLKAFAALSSGMRQVDRMLVRDEIDISDVILSAYVMKRGLGLLEDALKQIGAHVGNLGTVIIGTVLGDIHDIGRTMVAMLLTARGFEVIDLGINVPTARFIEAIREYKPDILALSSLMTASAQEQRKVIEALKAEGLDDSVLVIVGGGAITRKYSEEIGADGYAPTAQRAVELAWRLAGQGLHSKLKDDAG